MSEKKAPENKREKEKLIHVTEEKLQAGKAEIMKIVAGLNGAEKLGDLLDKGRKKGRLSSGELMEALEEIDLESEQMDKIYDVLENMGIDTAGEDYLPELSGDDMPPIEEIEEIPEEEIVDHQTEVGLRQTLLGPLPRLDQLFHLPPGLRVQGHTLGLHLLQLALGLLAGDHGLGQGHLLLTGEQVNLADLL